MHAAYFFKIISQEPIGYNTNISTDGVEWGRLNIWIVLHVSFSWYRFYSNISSGLGLKY